VIVPHLLFLTAIAVSGLPAKEEAIRPGSIKPEDLKEYDTLEPARKEFVAAALKLAAGDQWLTYTYGSSDPSNGGLDCSGSMCYLLQQIHVDPPRTSGDLFEWVKSSNQLTEVPSAASTLDDPAFSKLTPGDLLFWSGTTSSSAEGAVSHVQMFLGHEKSDGLAVMAGASDGRSYRGKRRNGYGVFDFKLPEAGSKARFLGYGPPEFLQGSHPPAVAKNDPSPPAKISKTDPPAAPAKSGKKTAKGKGHGTKDTAKKKKKKRSSD
jgi:hypothetical protein